jgi:hypothetical protein
MTGSRWAELLVIGALLASTPAWAAEDPSRDCYDAQVLARIVRQVPTEIPDLGIDGEIIMRWPWFVELDVEHVARGSVPQQRIKALTVQHNYMRTEQPVRLWLRRNDLGGFNVLWNVDEKKPRRCTRRDGVGRAYIHPGPNQSLGDLEAEGEARYGRNP